jgi:hypothetical protein
MTQRTAKEGGSVDLALSKFCGKKYQQFRPLPLVRYFFTSV